MKKIILFLSAMLLLCNMTYAKDVIPSKVFGSGDHSFGVYQMSDRSMTLFAEPDDKSSVVQNLSWDDESVSLAGVELQDLFVLYLPDRNLALLTVIDETEDWVKVVYDSKTGNSAWLKKDDPYKFMPWGTFYNIYGKKYGLYQLKQAPDASNIIRVGADNFSQVVGELNMPKKIVLNVIKGNWALVSVVDLDKYPKTGFVRWRGDNGEKYYFPLIKRVVGINEIGLE